MQAIAIGILEIRHFLYAVALTVNATSEHSCQGLRRTQIFNKINTDF